MIDPVVSVSLRCLLALLFASAAWHKWADSRRFASIVEAYRIAPATFARLLGRVVPAVEAAIAFGLLLPLYRWGAIAAAGLLVAFNVAIAVNLARGRRDIDCGCFAERASVPLGITPIVRNTLLIGAAAVVCLPLEARTIVWVDAFSIVACVTAGTFVWASSWRLLHLRHVVRGAA